MRELGSPDLASRTTIRLGGRAIAEIIVDELRDLDRLPTRLSALGGEPLAIGRGSNLLARDGELPITLVRLNLPPNPVIAGGEGEKVFVRVPANTPLPALLRFCQRNGLSGLEGLTGIPGTVGGAVAMNAGSFGTDTATHLREVGIFTGGEIKICGPASLRPGYRRMDFINVPNNPLILFVIFTLTKASKSVIFQYMRHNFFEKKSRQPLAAWSAGCAFKNPEGEISAGRLLDMAGFRGAKKGGMSFSAMHANFLINEGRGNAAQALELLEEGRLGVMERFGINLETEVKIIPCPMP